MYCIHLVPLEPGIKLGRIPPDLRSGTSYLRSTISNLGSATAIWRSITLMLRSTAIKLNVKSHRSVGSQYKADHCESTNVNKQKLLNSRWPETSVVRICTDETCRIIFLTDRSLCCRIAINLCIHQSKIGVGFPTFMDASYSKLYRVGIYTQWAESQTVGDARILHG